MSLFRVCYVGILLYAGIVIVNCLLPTATINRGLWKLFSFHSSARLVTLNAKKKGSSLISNEFLAAITEEDDRFSNLSDTTTRTNTKGTSTSIKNKKSEGKKKLVSDSLLQSILMEDDEQIMGLAKSTLPVVPVPEQHETRQKHANKEPSESFSESKEEGVLKARKDKPSARVRFTTTSQPNYVNIGLVSVSVTIGNEVILKDASLLISTGERVGLVGPNGGGKVKKSNANLFILV